MHEPKYPPKLNKQLTYIPVAKYGTRYQKEFVDMNSPEIEPPHLHSYMEIVYNVASDISFFINDKVYNVLPGEAVVSRANDLHACIYHKSCVHEWFCFWIDDRTYSTMFSFLSKKDFYPVFSFEGEKQQKVYDILKYLATVDEQDEFKKTVHVLQLLLLFDGSSSPRRAEKQVPSEFQSLLDDVNENFVSIYRLNDVLERHFVSPATVNRWFHKYLHMSFHEYLITKKLSHAAKLLLSGSNVTEACMDSGFSDCSHFITYFKKRFGETPLEYKKNRNHG